MILKIKVIKKLLHGFGLIFLLFPRVDAAEFNQVLTVPFQNITLSAHSLLVASYSFGLHPIIFCFNNTTTNQGIISWPLNRTVQHANLAIFLKTSDKYEGEFADASGNLTIQNNLNTSLVVGCLFGF